MKHLSLLLLGIASLGCWSMPANAEPTGAEGSGKLTPLEQDPNVVVGRLDNGLTYIIRHNELPKNTADFYIAQKVGAILEEDNQNGLAHFLEHMAFNGTKNFPGKGIINFLEKVGVRFGENINAYTSLDETVYNLESVPTTDKAIVDSAILVLHDWSGFISLEGPEIDKERGVIREEWRTRASAARRMYFKHMENTMPGTQYAKRDVIGDTAVINNFKYDELRAYYKKWYRPDLQGIVIVGDIDPKYVEGKIKEMWKDIPRKKNAAERIYYKVPLNKEPVFSILRDKEATRTSVQLQYRYLPVSDEVKNSVEYTRHQIVGSLTEQVMNTRFSELTVKGASFAGAYMTAGSLTQTIEALQFVCSCKNGKTAEAISEMMDEVEKLRRYGVNPTELERAKENLYATYDNAYENRNKVQTPNYVGQYYDAFLNNDIITSIEYDRKLIKELTPGITMQDIDAFIAERLQVAPVLMISGMETDNGIASAADYLAQIKGLSARNLEPYEDKQIDRDLVKEHEKGTIVGWEANDIYGGKVAKLSNGIKVHFLPTTLSDNQILLGGFRKGGYSSMDSKYAASADVVGSVCKSMGLGRYSQPDLSKALTGKSVNCSAQIGLYTDGIVGGSSKKDLETMLQMVYLNMGAPREDKGAYEALMSRYASMLENVMKNPDNVYSDTISRIMSDGNPYSPVISRPADLKMISMEDVVKIHTTRMSTAQGMEFAVIGSFNTDSIAPIVGEWLGSLNTKEAAAGQVDRMVYRPQKPVECTIEQEMTTKKTSCYIVMNGKRAYDKKEANAILALGRVLDMRYLESIREDEGGSYGVSVRGSLTREPDSEYALSISFDTDPAAFDRLYPIVFEEIKKISKKGPKAEDLDKVKKHMIKSHEEALQQNSTWLSRYKTMFLYNGDDRQYNDVVNSITAKDLKKWAKRILKSNRIVVNMKPKK